MNIVTPMANPPDLVEETLCIDLLFILSYKFFFLKNRLVKYINEELNIKVKAVIKINFSIRK